MTSGESICSTKHSNSACCFQGSRRISLLRLLLRRLLLRTFLDLVAFVGDRSLRAEALVIGVLHDLADVHVVHLEMQRVIGKSVGRKPVAAVDLLAPGRKLGEEIFVVLLANIGDG